jgi:DNA polymerase-1
MEGTYSAGIYLADFEFRPRDGRAGNPPDPVCFVVKRLDTGTTSRIWADELKSLTSAPFPTGPDALWIAYFSSAEWGCFLTLGWQPPEAVVDLYVEFRCLTNGVAVAAGNGLIGAMTHFNLATETQHHKDEMRQLILSGGPWTIGEKKQILDYCESDVIALEKLFTAMRRKIDIPRAELRGRYMVAVARMEQMGIPIDIETLERFTTHWDSLKSRLISVVDQQYGVYEDGRFRLERFAAWLSRNNIAWPVLPSGQLNLDDDTFRVMSLLHPRLAPLRSLRSTLSKTRQIQLEIGSDGRSRCLLSPFKSKTGRNQPSTNKFPYGLPGWMRFLIKPARGRGLAYIDWEQQEFGIGAAMSGDTKMWDAYRSGDPYLEFARQAGAVPKDATKQSHGVERDQFKECILGTQYGLGAKALGERIGVPTARAKQLLELHRTTYPQFWTWSDNAVSEALLGGKLWTCFGWQINTENELNDRSLRNFPMQAHGAEMLRIACILMTEARIRVCAPVHDAVLIEAPLDALETTVERAQALMAEASRLVLNGLELRTEAALVRHPDRSDSKKGKAMWDTVQQLLREVETGVRQ